jgi:hypothetical protein
MDRFWDKDKEDSSRYYFNIPFVILTNALLFPDYTTRIYITKKVTENKLWPIFEILFDSFSKEGFLQLVIEDLNYLFTEPSILRMKPLWEYDVEVFHPKDIDSIITETEYKYIRTFEQSNFTAGCIRSHEYHFGTTSILAGLSSFKPHQIGENIKGNSFDAYFNKAHGSYGCDQDLMAQVFTTDVSFTSEKYMDCRSHRQHNLPNFPCHSFDERDLNVEIKGLQREVLDKVREVGFENWSGEPVDARGDYGNYLLEKFPKVLDKIKSNDVLASFYKVH